MNSLIKSVKKLFVEFVSIKNILYDVPESSAINIGKEFARRIKSIFGLRKDENGFSTPYKDFTHTHMAEINELVTYAIATPAGLSIDKLDRSSMRHQLRIQQCWDKKFSIVQWPRHMDYMRLIDEDQKLWRFSWQDMVPRSHRMLVDSHQDVRIFQRSTIASLLAEKENHSAEADKPAFKRFRGLTEYLIGVKDQSIKPHDYEDFKVMDKIWHEKIGMNHRIKLMIQPWKGSDRGIKNNSARRANSRGRSRSKSFTRKRAFRGASVSPMRRKITKRATDSSMCCHSNKCKSATTSMMAIHPEKSFDQEAETSRVSNAEMSVSFNHTRDNTSMAETTILSGMTEASSRTESLQDDKNVSFSVTGKP